MPKETKVLAMVVLTLLAFTTLWIGSKVQSITAQNVTPTPQPFLLDIFYGVKPVWQIFDHDLPLAGTGTDNNDSVTNHDGIVYNAVTITPIPGASPTPTDWATPAPYIAKPGYGYDQHGGIDYGLIYEPVLASSNGIVSYAGWSNPSNHRASYGLYVDLSHTANPDYTTRYAHLSSLSVQTGEVISFNSSDPGNRVRILGTSGNTGNVFGPDGLCPNLNFNPKCGVHLHFEVHKNGIVVNPYGWVADEQTPDPWSAQDNGETSYIIWQGYPVISSNQYPSGDSSIPTPSINDARINIDDSSELWSGGPCWQYQEDPDGYYGAYHWANANEYIPPSPTYTLLAPVSPTKPLEITPTVTPIPCFAQWELPDFDRLFAGEYDIYIRIPAFASSLSAPYTIFADGESNYREAIVVQAGYPPVPSPTPGYGLAYIGRYDLEFNGNDRITLNNQTFELDNGNVMVADMVSLVPASPNHNVLYLSSNDEGVIEELELPFSPEDILVYDGQQEQWGLLFDGSDVGLNGVNLDALHLQGNTILLSINLTRTLPDLSQPVGDKDVLLFDPTTLGQYTSGTFSLYFDGAEHGLEETSEGIDAIAISPNGKLIISTHGDFVVPGDFGFVTGNGMDLLAFDWTTETWEMYFDGSDVDLNGFWENIWGVYVAPSGVVYITVPGSFDSGGMIGTASDIFFCVPALLGEGTACKDGLFGRYWAGGNHGIEDKLDAISLAPPAPPPLDCTLNWNGGFESGLDCWTVINVPEARWVLNITEAHSGWHSVEAQFIDVQNDAWLQSSLLPILADHQYRLNIYSRGTGDNPLGTGVGLYLNWYDGDVFLETSSLGQIAGVETNWHQELSEFVCPPEGADHVQVEFMAFANTLFTPTTDIPSIFIDDVVVESQTGSCPLQP